MHAEVLVSLALRQVDKVFHYNVPPSLAGKVQVGSRVLVPFGRRKVEGYVVGFSPAPNPADLKDVAALLDEGPLFTPHQLALARWMAAYYLCPTVKALRAMIWPLLQVKGPKKVRGLWPAACCEVPDPRRAPKSAAVWQVIQARPGLSRKELAEAAGVSPRVVDAMVARGLLRSEERIEFRDPCQDLPEKRIKPPVLHGEQIRAVSKIIEALDQKGGRQVFLLHGVTGSGKTEVYLHAIAAALARGKQAMMLVPEIALTPQMIDIFRGRFGRQVAVLHSRLSDGERYDEYQRLRTGEAGVVLGARSAIFAPLEQPGLIILDEEHEPSYKQEESPRYHARTVALRLAGYAGAVVVLGSATPSLESYCQAVGGGVYHLLEMTRRVGELPLPSVRLVDLRRELQEGNKGIFSRDLQEAIARRLSRREQVILFLNRRGYSTLVVCRECGLVLKCPYCDISLTYHVSGRLRCHYCNYSVLAPSLCPGCGSRHVAYLGMGTQKVEQEIRRLFPTARVLRLDSDTVGRRGAHREIVDSFREGEADILIGTQMVAKGLDIPGVTLVGVINADISLYMPDFRASERTFQLLTQVAGRSGRGEQGGEVLIQTYSPDHYAVTCAQNHDYQGFYRREMALRRTLGYPPYTHLARLLVTGRMEKEVQEAADFLAQAVHAAGVPVELLGPAPAPLTRIKDRYRWHLVLKASAQGVLREAVTVALDGFSGTGRYRRVQVSVDIAPQSMM
ncbi:replication restart helicase PriA [Desulfofundulus salinus]|uniref:Replication restart protein PriA n=1 Tax=Desulfofundulus salinus TaxID=2419843 RepID=A0A494X2B3_9FIRM|nr:primosomal protein N' [Desulfofundulus salinum]RKO67295.1 primosomal protein N' [Desulfofundulus salinum]